MGTHCEWLMNVKDRHYFQFIIDLCPLVIVNQEPVTEEGDPEEWQSQCQSLQIYLRPAVTQLQFCYSYWALLMKDRTLKATSISSAHIGEGARDYAATDGCKSKFTENWDERMRGLQLWSNLASMFRQDLMLYQCWTNIIMNWSLNLPCHKIRIWDVFT